MSAARVTNTSTSASGSGSGSDSVLRPRTRRLISGLDEGDEEAFDPSTAPHISIASPVASIALEHSQRSVSPIPSTHLPRPTSSYDRRLNTGSLERGTGVRTLGQDNATSLERLWGTSWTAIQGIASDLLGSSAQDGPPLAKGKVPRPRRTLERGSSHRTSASAPPLIWGPQTPGESPTINDVGVGTREVAEAAFRAKKRLDLLTGHETSFTDSMGRYKRRTSDEIPRNSLDPASGEFGDALVYVHHVQKGDTLAGITLKYSCSANVVRKANRLWPNDPVQTRTHILLPVDACGVKGRPTTEDEVIDLLGDENAPIPSGGHNVKASASLAVDGEMDTSRPRSDSTLTQTTADRSSSKARSNTASDIIWQHNSWVILPGSTIPTEIARLSRQVLGYFPPARRKSQTFSDLDSPKTSLDNARSFVAESLSNDVSRSPSGRAGSAQPSHHRKHSTATNGHLSSYLSGPGGVGTMDRAVRAPGPALDSLNIMFAKHLPDVAPPRNQHALYQPDLPLFTDDITPTASGLSTPSAGVNKNLEHMGGAIEAWMRRVASKAKDAMDPAERRQRMARASVGAPAKGVGGIGDLIEMTDEFEIGAAENGDDDDEIGFYDDSGRGRPASSILDMGAAGSSSTASSARQNGARLRDVGKSKKN